jgi:putative peptidoglycan lipid II flippase
MTSSGGAGPAAAGTGTREDPTLGASGLAASGARSENLSPEVMSPDVPSADGASDDAATPTSERDRETAPAGRRGPLARLSAGIASAAALIAALTLVSRVLGFVRTLVQAHAVGGHAVSDAYIAANSVPNSVLNIVIGGALASVGVPLLAGPLARGARDEAARVVSALLTWTLALLVPLTVLGMIFVVPLGEALGHGHAGGAAYTALLGRLLLVFLPQLPLYGVSVVVSAALQADRRFFAPALAPLASSVVVIAAYATFGVMDPGARDDLSRLTRPAELVLSIGTTAGVAMLAGIQLPALRRSGLRLRPTFAFPPGFARRARTLAAAGVSTLAAQQIVNLAVVRLTNTGHAASGSLSLFYYAQNIYNLPYAVLAVPIATSAFTELSARFEHGDRERYTATAAGTTRAVMLVGCLGAALLAAAAYPAARLYFPAHSSAGTLMAEGLIALAPGLIGYGFTIHLANVLYAAGRGRSAAVGVVTGWLGVLVADIVLVRVMPGGEAVTALGIGNLIGMTLAGVLLLVAVRRVAGRAALRGLPRAALAGLLGATVGALLGRYLIGLVGVGGVVMAVLLAVVAAVVVLLVMGGALLLLDGGDLRALISRRFSRG